MKQLSLLCSLALLFTMCNKEVDENTTTTSTTSTTSSTTSQTTTQQSISYYINGHKTEPDSIKAKSDNYGIYISGLCDKCVIANGTNTGIDTRISLFIPNFNAILGEYHADYPIDSLGATNVFNIYWKDNAYPSGEFGDSNIEPYNGSTITITAFDAVNKLISGTFKGKLKASKSGYINILNGTFTNIKYN